MNDTITEDIVRTLGFADEIARMQALLEGWIAETGPDLRPLLEWQFVAGSKYFRPLTIFACYRGAVGGAIPDTMIRSAAVLEMLHNMSLVIDDILVKSDERRV